MTPFHLTQGDAPLLLAMPHGGTWLPPEVAGALNPAGAVLSDTDWHIDRLYAGLLPGASVIRATVHRYAIDANRDPSGASLYPGRNTTGLVPLTDFDGAPIWADPPDEAETERRRLAFHAPYHAALAAELARIRSSHGVAILFDCHSIRSRIPFLFEGTLPCFNIGTNGGTTCAPEIEAAAEQVCAASGDSHILNGRFRGGWTTRHYGRPGEGVHAIQMESAQSSYMAEAPPWAWDDAAAARTRATLKTLLNRLVTLAPSLRSRA